MIGTDEIRIERWLIDRAGLSGARLLVAAAVIGACGAAGGAAPASVAQVCAATGLGRSTVRRALSSLVEDGILDRATDAICADSRATAWEPGARARAFMDGGR